MGLLRAVIVAIALSDLAPSLKTASRVSPTSDTATKRTRDRGRRTHPRRSLTACYRTRNRPSRCLGESSKCQCSRETAAYSLSPATMLPAAFSIGRRSILLCPRCPRSPPPGSSTKRENWRETRPRRRRVGTSRAPALPIRRGARQSSWMFL